MTRGRPHLTRRQILQLATALPLTWIFAACNGRATEEAQSTPIAPPAPSPGSPVRPAQASPATLTATAEIGGYPPVKSGSPLVKSASPPASPSPSPDNLKDTGGNFYTRVIVNDPRFQSTEIISDLALLEPVTRRKVQSIIAAAKAQGVDLMVFETYRSRQRQERLFGEGVTRLKLVGVHHYGLACDLVRNVNGNPSWAGDFSLLGRLAHEHRLIWGGDWGKPDEPNDFVDAYHLERCAMEKRPELFAGTWYPDEDYDPYAS